MTVTLLCRTCTTGIIVARGPLPDDENWQCGTCRMIEEGKVAESVRGPRPDDYERCRP